MSTIIEQHIPCPVCPSSDAYCVYDDGHGYCFSCNTYIGGPKNGNDFTYEYLPWRGISKGTMESYGVRTKVDSEGRPISIGFTYPNGSIQHRQLDDKEFWWGSEVPHKPGLFGRDKFNSTGYKYVTIAEGAIDALSLYEVLKGPVVAVQSAGSAVRDCSVERSWLNQFERIYIAFDADAPGAEAAAGVAKLFDYNKVYHVKYGSRKDANDFLEAGLGAELKSLWWNATKYKPENIISTWSEFERILNTPDPKGVPYPFPTWNEMTYGMRRGETVLITAQEGVGKTQLMHHLEYQLLKETDDGVASIFLETGKKRHLQSLAGLELNKPVHLPEHAIPEADVLSTVKKITRVDDRLNIYNHYGSDDPRVLEDTIRFLVSVCGVVWVLLDHVGMVVSGLRGEDERTALDYFTTRLAMMVQELNFGLIEVSHVNDNNQTRGSRLIGKNANTRFDLTRNILSDDPVVKHTTAVSLSKNRFAHLTGHAGNLFFDTNTYKYKELIA